ncbi:MAG TPA: TlpA disulfide reductase family protein [Flavisolibacter sp.]|nr:TlpA disulfide reductase family protein [Flavisolibacter sp.]
MRTKLILFLLCSLAMTAHAQETNSKSLDIGDPAPAIKVRKWLKGTPVTAFEKGRVYVVEFWATWCAPCIAGMPHLSGLARSYKDKVTVSGISILERKATTPARVDAFVDSMGNRMDYNVAADDSHYMATNWFRASGEKGIHCPLSLIKWGGLPG